MDRQKMFEAIWAKRPSMGEEPYESRSHHESKCALFDGRECDCAGYEVFTFIDECWRVLASGEVVEEENKIWYLEHQGPPSICSVPNCNCGAGGEMYLHAACHPAAGLYVCYDDLGTLTVTCRECKKVLRRYAVAYLDNGE